MNRARQSTTWPRSIEIRGPKSLRACSPAGGASVLSKSRHAPSKTATRVARIIPRRLSRRIRSSGQTLNRDTLLRPAQLIFFESQPLEGDVVPGDTVEGFRDFSPMPGAGRDPGPGRAMQPAALDLHTSWGGGQFRHPDFPKSLGNRENP